MSTGAELARAIRSSGLGLDASFVGTGQVVVTVEHDTPIPEEFEALAESLDFADRVAALADICDEQFDVGAVEAIVGDYSWNLGRYVIVHLGL